MALRVIFLKKDASIFARLIRLWTWSPYCHSEILFSDGSTFSSHAGFGTRFGRVPFMQEPRWDVLEVSMPEEDEQRVRTFCTGELGCGYDWWGILASQVLGLRREHPHKWFCSEACAAGLKLVGFPLRQLPCMYSPGGLYKALLQLGAVRSHF